MPKNGVEIITSARHVLALGANVPCHAGRFALVTGPEMTAVRRCIAGLDGELLSNIISVKAFTVATHLGVLVEEFRGSVTNLGQFIEQPKRSGRRTYVFADVRSGFSNTDVAQVLSSVEHRLSLGELMGLTVLTGNVNETWLDFHETGVIDAYVANNNSGTTVAVMRDIDGCWNLQPRHNSNGKRRIVFALPGQSSVTH